MWAENEIEAINLGISLDYFWGDITPNIFRKYIKAKQEKIKQEMKMIDISNHTLGMYIKYAIVSSLDKHTKYPKEPFSNKQSNLVRVYSDIETEAYVKAMEKNNVKSDKH